MVKKWTMNPTPIELIKESVGIVEVLEFYANVKFKRTDRLKLSISCPFHNDKSPSMTIYLDSNKCRCWQGCGNGKPMDVVDVVALARGVNTKEAIKLLLNDFKLTIGKMDSINIHKNILMKKDNLSFQKELNEALSYVERIILDTKGFIRKYIQAVEDIETYGHAYHGLDLYYQLECLLKIGDIETKKRAISEVKALRKELK